MDEHAVIMARALRLGVIRNLLGQDLLDRNDALELLNAPLSPDGPDQTVYDDRDKIDWTEEQFSAWMNRTL